MYFEKYDMELPSERAVCTRCNGDGKHTNPSIDGNGLTQSDIDEAMHDDDSFLDNYFGGVYDVLCEVCNGNRVIDIPDYEHCTTEQLQEIKEIEQSEYESRMDRQAELRAGC